MSRLHSAAESENPPLHLLCAAVLAKRIPRKYGYPLVKQAKATETVLEQAEVLSEAWAADYEVTANLN